MDNKKWIDKEEWDFEKNFKKELTSKEFYNNNLKLIKITDWSDLEKSKFKLLFHDGWKDNPLSFDYDEYYKKQDDFMKKINKFKIESWDDLDKHYLDAEEQQEYIRDSYKKHFEKIHPLSGEYLHHYENFSIEKLEELLKALANNKTDDGRNI